MCSEVALFVEPVNSSFLEGVAIGQSIPESFSALNRKEEFRIAWNSLRRTSVFSRLNCEDGTNPLELAGYLEGLGYGCSNTGFLLALGAHCFAVCSAIRAFDKSGSHSAILQSLSCGELIGAFAATEPDAGSDVMSMKTGYVRVPEGFILSGFKSHIANSVDADIFLTIATRDRRLRDRGLSAFVVSQTRPGVSVGNDKLRSGLTGASWGDVSFSDVALPCSDLVGAESAGAELFRAAMLRERSLIFAILLGVIRRQLEQSITHARGRQQFRKSIGTNQSVAFRIVDMYRDYAMARLLVRDTISQLLAGTADGWIASLTKLVVSETLLSSSLASMLTHGGSGFASPMDTSKAVADACGALLLSGTSDMQRVVIAAELGLYAV